MCFCGFQKVHKTQHSLFKLLQSWQEEVDNRSFADTILIDLLKAYDSIPPEQLIAMLECYGLDKTSLRLTLDYLTNRKQRTKIGSAFTSWYDISTGVPEGLICGTLLFNTFINNLFLSITTLEVCNFVCSYNLFIDGASISCSNEVKLLGITIANQLKFKKRTDDLCKKTSPKLHALRRLRPYLTIDKAKLIANSFVDIQFIYAPLIWMFAGKTAINTICKIHYRILQVVSNNFNDSYDTLLSINNDISIHQKHLWYLAVEVHKTVVEIIS